MKYCDYLVQYYVDRIHNENIYLFEEPILIRIIIIKKNYKFLFKK